MMEVVMLKTCKKTMWLWLVLAAFVFLPTTAKAAEGFTNKELDTLVSTIALYPDPLLVHVLTAATYGDQIPAASAWAQSHKHLNGEALATAMENANLTFDPSVQALIPFPTVLATMATYRTWSDQLGDAVSFQKDQVLDAIQRMRQVAYNYGHLKTDDQVVVTKGDRIIIEPTRTEYVYVPVYSPRVVYYVYADRYHPAVRYHHHAWLGTWYGEWGWGSCWFDWHAHYIYVRDYRWYPHRPIPHHPRRYNPPPRRHHHYRPEPPRHSRTEPPRHHETSLRKGLSDRRSGEIHKSARVESSRPNHRVETSRDVRSQAASAKNHNVSVIKSSDTSRRSQKAESYSAPQKHESARSEAKRETSQKHESTRRATSSNNDDRWESRRSESHRSNSGTSARSNNSQSDSHRSSGASRRR